MSVKSLVALALLLGLLSASPAAHSEPSVEQGTPKSTVTSLPSLNLPISKQISVKDLDGHSESSVEVDDNGHKVTFTGVTLRSLLSEMLPEIKLDSMPVWKLLARKRLVMEVLGSDGFPGLVTVLEIATNKKGDRFILAKTKDGQPVESVQLICHSDEARTRWVKQVVALKIVALPE